MNLLEIAKPYTVARNNKIKRNTKFGRSPALMDTAYEQIWDGGVAYTYPTTAAQLQISSSSVSDITTKVITLVGLNADFDEVTENLTLAGQTAVVSTLTYSRIYRAYLSSGTTLVGDVYVSTAGAALTLGVPGTASTIKAKILIFNNQTQMSIISVPRGYSMVIPWAHTSVTANTANISCRVRSIGSNGAMDDNAFRVVYEFDQGAVNMNFTPDPPIVIPEMCDYEVGAAFNTGTTNTISCIFGYYLVPNS